MTDSMKNVIPEQEALLDVDGLRLVYDKHHTDAAVDGFNLQMAAGESVAIVGESGAGKSSVSHMIALLVHPTSGKICWQGRDVTDLKGARLREMRRRIQLVGQDPTLAFDPRWSIRQTLAEPLKNFSLCENSRLDGRIGELLDMVQIPAGIAERRPCELSGGQLQRVAIARALAVNPELIVFDEATSALDMTVQEQILELLERVRAERNISYLFVHHDLAVAQRMSERIIVMRRGEIVTSFPSDNLAHVDDPYVTELLSAVLTVPGHAMSLPSG